MNQFINSLKAGQDSSIAGLQGSAPALLVAGAVENSGRPALCIVPSEHHADSLRLDINLFSSVSVDHYPGFDIPPYTPLSPDPKTVAARLSLLYKTLTADKPFILIVSVEALLRRVMPKNILARQVELVIAGEDTDAHQLALQLAASGYEPASLVQQVGDFSIRGGIFDVFPPGYDQPVRLDFFGDTVESIRTFDSVSQRSHADLQEAVFLPASNILFPAVGSDDAAALMQRLENYGNSLNWNSRKAYEVFEKINNSQRFPGIEFLLPLFFPEPSILLDYLPKTAQIFLVDSLAIQQSAQLARERISTNYNEALAAAEPALPPTTVFLSEDDLRAGLSSFDCIRINELPCPSADQSAAGYIKTEAHKLLQQKIDLERKEHGLIPPLGRIIRKWLQKDEAVVMACRSAGHAKHLAELLAHHEMSVELCEPPVQYLAHHADTVQLYPLPLTAGFDLVTDSGKTAHFLSETELFGERRLGPQHKTGKAKHPESGAPVKFDELQQGDLVVHNEHGIGVYQGLVTIELLETTNDFLHISYQEEDKLYVPVDRINSVHKYKGLADKKPKIDKLGSKSWSIAKSKVKQEVWKIAQDLLNLYARRNLEEGRSFTRPGELYHELEESFPFEPTPGQKKAFEEVLEDLISEKPMDRLICGDVGYGKTEVAVRAAFKVVEDGGQVAILVPTTVLAEQHTATFRDRLHGFPVVTECLSRFRSRAEQKTILTGLERGTIDIVIGTHRLLSKDVLFKQLGLLVIDEEHRFGVSHKEKIKKLRTKIDVLSLTATPIPRTLQLSLLSIRDLSIINTPPALRRKILTFVARDDDLVIKEAVVRELQRGGQVFFVHNRVQSIGRMAQRISRLAPLARIAVAHGQLAGKDLEDIMVRFVRREIDILICTTIIESGLDISNANTIIINRADRLGLAEIYQLRGRVGRSREQSYAYLLVPSMDGLTKDAKDRLSAIMEYSDLGGGFKLAMSDLQIRGGGNILGTSQSGHIAAVGYDLYLELLQQTVQDLKNQAENITAEESIEPEVNINVSAYIPERYIVHTDQRYLTYRRIAAVISDVELDDLKEEMEDRYGQIPQECANLFQVMHLKLILKELKISKLEQGKDNLVFSFHNKTIADPQKVLLFMEKAKGRVRLTPDAKLIVHLSEGKEHAGALLAEAQHVLEAIR